MHTTTASAAATSSTASSSAVVEVGIDVRCCAGEDLLHHLGLLLVHLHERHLLLGIQAHAAVHAAVLTPCHWHTGHAAHVHAVHAIHSVHRTGSAVDVADLVHTSAVCHCFDPATEVLATGASWRIATVPSDTPSATHTM